MFTHPPTENDVLAAIDIGTNNCRLLVARLVPTLQADGSIALKPEIVDAFSRLVRLGEGISRNTELQENAIIRTLEALSVCVSKMRRRCVTRYRAVATEACRRAGNREAFVTRVKELTGLDIEVIDAAEEARLALQGCAPLFEEEYDYGIHFGIGGGSTEVAWAKLKPAASLQAQTSLPCGVTALTETYGDGLLSPESYRRMVDEIKSHIRPFAAEIAASFETNAAKVQFLGCAGTISTIAALVQDLPFYQRMKVDGHHLRMQDARQIFERLLKLDFSQRAEISALGEERADLILAGCAIVEAIADTWNALEIRVADRGVREGILYDLAGIHRLEQA